MRRLDVYAAIDAERERQRDKWDRPHSWGSGDCSSADVTWTVKSMVLTEETGEVARAILDLDWDNTPQRVGTTARNLDKLLRRHGRHDLLAVLASRADRPGNTRPNR